jgi:hypothetical protein
MCTQALLCNHRRCGKGTRITYSKCVSVVLVIQDTKCMRRIALSPVCDLSGTTTFFHITS